MATVTLKDVKKIYDNKVTAVHSFNLEIADKEFIVLVGPSGCGKSTTLRMVAGLEEISEGELYIDDKLVNNVEPKDRDIAMVFQSYALYPHMTVRENMEFPLKLKKVPKDEIKRRVDQAAPAWPSLREQHRWWLVQSLLTPLTRSCPRTLPRSAWRYRLSVRLRFCPAAAAACRARRPVAHRSPCRNASPGETAAPSEWR